MEGAIRVLLVDENREALAALGKQLNYADLEVVGEAGFGPVAYTWANQLQPDAMVVVVEEPIARALRTVEVLTLGQVHWPVVVVSSKSDPESMRKAMRAGADDYVSKRGGAEDLRGALVSLVGRRREREAMDASGGKPAGHTGTIISVFGVKGGIGKTTVATNLAASIAIESKQRVALIDLDLQFGDVAMVMEVSPDKTILDVVETLDELDADLVDTFLARHPTGVSVLPSPLHVEGAEKITGDNVQRVLDVLAAGYDFVILDAPNTLNETVQVALDMSTLVFLVTTPELSCIKRTKSCLDLMKYWQYSDDKVKLIINKAYCRAGVIPDDIESVLQYPAFTRLPFDEVADAVSGSGGLFVHTNPEAKISCGISELSKRLLGIESTPKPGLLNEVRLRLALSGGRWGLTSSLISTVMRAPTSLWKRTRMGEITLPRLSKRARADRNGLDDAILAHAELEAGAQRALRSLVPSQKEVARLLEQPPTHVARGQEEPVDEGRPRGYRERSAAHGLLKATLSPAYRRSHRLHRSSRVGESGGQGMEEGAEGATGVSGIEVALDG